MDSLLDHSSEALDLKLIAFKEEEVKKIYMNKFIYSILKYNMQPENIRKFFKEKYEYTANLHRGYFEGGNIQDVKEYLDEEKEKFDTISEKNQKVIDYIFPMIIGNFISGCIKNTQTDRLIDFDKNELANLNPSELEKAYIKQKRIMDSEYTVFKEKEYNEEQRAKYLIEYMINTLTYNYNAQKYNYDIPFGTENIFEFSNNVPIKDIKGLLITKEVLSSDIVYLAKMLGAYIGLDILVVKCKYKGKDHLINAIKLHKVLDEENNDYDYFNYDLSYFDITNVITGEREKNSALLSSLAGLNLFGDDISYKDLEVVGENINIEETEETSRIYKDIEIKEITPILEIDKKLSSLATQIEYAENDIFKAK